MTTLPDPPDIAADVLRGAFDPDDLADLGIRDHGPLDWVPDGDPQPTSRVERGRLRVLARRKIARIEARRRATRAFLKAVAA